MSLHTTSAEATIKQEIHKVHLSPIERNYVPWIYHTCKTMYVAQD